ncbi:MAG: thermonuclease family protein [Desulfosoma sp.]
MRHIPLAAAARSTRKLSRTFWILILGMLAIGAETLFEYPFAKGADSSNIFRGSSMPASGVVVKVLDGDTVILEGGLKVRYMGIDTPEMDHETGRHDCYAVEAHQRNQTLVLGRSVRLSYDVVKKDNHGRILAYVTTSDGVCVNGELLRGGFGYVSRGPEGFSRFEEFLGLQRQAVLERRGLHGNCLVREDSSYLGNTRSYIFHRLSCLYGTKTHPQSRISFSSRWEALLKGYRPCRQCQP